MHAVVSVIRWLVWPVYMALFLSAFAVTRHLGLDPGLSILGITIAHMATIALTELLLPARTDWLWTGDRQVFNDVVHGILLDLGARAGAATLTIAIATAAAATPSADSAALWPAHWPFLAQLLLAVLVYDLVDYWKHRAYHAWQWLWPVHALHHDKAFGPASVNLSPFTLTFDHLFGTFRDPNAQPVAEVGISNDPIPRNVAGQLLAPLAFLPRLRRWLGQ